MLTYIMEHKGYLAQIKYSQQDKEFFGTIVNLSRDSICFGGKTLSESKKHMKEAIEGHLKNCKSLNIDPELPFSITGEKHIGSSFDDFLHEEGI